MQRWIMRGFILTYWRAAASFNSSSASEKFINHWFSGWSLVSPLFFSLILLTGPTEKSGNFETINSMTKKAKEQNETIPGGGKFKPEGSLGTIAAGWFWTRANNASVGSEKTISSYISTTTGFLVDWGPFSSSGNNFSWWYLWTIITCHLLSRLDIKINVSARTYRSSCLSHTSLWKKSLIAISNSPHPDSESSKGADSTTLVGLLKLGCSWNTARLTMTPKSSFVAPRT